MAFRMPFRPRKIGIAETPAFDGNEERSRTYRISKAQQNIIRWRKVMACYRGSRIPTDQRRLVKAKRELAMWVQVLAMAQAPKGD